MSYPLDPAPTTPTKPLTVQEILESETLDPTLVEKAERIVVGKLGPLTRTTNGAQWDAYWQAVADQVNEWLAS